MNEMPNCFYRVSIKALILNEARDKFLVCRENSNYWELPGGGLEWDVMPQEDLKREIMEEMGLNVLWVADNPSYFLTGQQTTNPNIKIANIIYECTLEHYNFRPSDECEGIKFVDVNDVNSMQVFDGVAKLAQMFKPENHQLTQ